MGYRPYLPNGGAHDAIVRFIENIIGIRRCPRGKNNPSHVIIEFF